MLEERASFSPDALTGARGQSALRRAGDDGDAHFRPAHRLAELDLPAPQRGRRRRRAETLRHRPSAPASTRNGCRHRRMLNAAMPSLAGNPRAVAPGPALMPGIGLRRMREQAHDRCRRGRLRRADPEQCRAQRRSAAAPGAGKLAPGLARLVEGARPRGVSVEPRLSAHRDQRRARGLGQVRLCQDAGLPLGHPAGAAGRGPHDPASARTRASRPGRRCRANTARCCAG